MRRFAPFVALALTVLNAPASAVGDPAAPPRCKGQIATVVGTAGPDVLEADKGDVVAGLGGADRISGSFHIACGGPGPDTIVLEAEGAIVLGGRGHDTLDHEGFPEQTVMRGGRGNDHVRGYASLVVGGPGNDVLDAGISSTISYQSAHQRIVAHLDRGIVTGQGRDRLICADTILGSRFADVFIGRGRCSFYVFGAQGDDVIDAVDITYGNRGDDTIRGAPGFQDLYGGPGDDSLSGGGGSDRLYGATGDDVLDGGPGNDECHGGEVVSRCEQ